METSASHVQPGAVPPVPLPAPGGRSVRTAPLKLPAIVLLLLWSVVPLAMTLWFSFQHYNLLNPGEERWAGIENYRFLVTVPGLGEAIGNTMFIVGLCLAVPDALASFLAVL